MRVKIDTSGLNSEEVRRLYWEKKYSIAEVAEKLGISFWRLYNFMNKYGIARRNYSETNYLVNKLKPQFNLSFADERLKIVSIMLYWAGGGVANRIRL